MESEIWWHNFIAVLRVLKLEIVVVVFKSHFLASDLFAPSIDLGFRLVSAVTGRTLRNHVVNLSAVSNGFRLVLRAIRIWSSFYFCSQSFIAAFPCFRSESLDVLSDSIETILINVPWEHGISVQAFLDDAVEVFIMWKLAVGNVGKFIETLFEITWLRVSRHVAWALTVAVFAVALDAVFLIGGVSKVQRCRVDNFIASEGL